MSSLRRYIEIEIFGGRKKFSYLRLLIILIFGAGCQKVILYYRLANYLYLNGYKRFSKLLFRKLENGYGVYISPNASIGIGLQFPHPTGIVIGNGVNIGENCIIYQQVTFGGARKGDAQKNFYPQVGNNVVVFAGAKLIGNILIHSQSIIGANSVVTKDVPEGCVAAGVPAKIKEKN
jgi:serine O-acetyltransferase